MNRRDFMLSTGLVASLGGVRLSEAATEDFVPGGDDPLGVRNDFPVLKTTNYLNTAYLSAVPLQVMEAGIAFDRSKAYKPMSLPEMMVGVEHARANYASFIGADADEIGFVYSTTDGENIIARSLDLKPGDNIVIDELHYTSTFVLYRELEKTRDIQLRIVPAKDGATPLKEFERLTDDRTRMISVSWVSHDNGYRHNMRALADLAHAHGAYVYVDATQAIGMIPTNVRDEDIDFMTGNGYKWMHAAFNAAGLYVRRELLDKIPPDRLGYLHVKQKPGFQYDQADTARKYEYATPAINGVYQLDRAIDYIRDIGIARIETHVATLANQINRGLRELGFHVDTPLGTRTGIVTFAHGRNGQEVRQHLEQAGIEVTHRSGKGHIRVSASLHTNRAEVDHFLREMARLG